MAGAAAPRVDNKQPLNMTPVLLCPRSVAERTDGLYFPGDYDLGEMFLGSGGRFYKFRHPCRCKSAPIKRVSIYDIKYFLDCRTICSQICIFDIQYKNEYKQTKKGKKLRRKTLEA